MAPSSYIAATADSQQQPSQKSLKYISGYDNEGKMAPGRRQGVRDTERI